MVKFHAQDDAKRLTYNFLKKNDEFCLEFCNIFLNNYLLSIYIHTL